MKTGKIIMTAFLLVRRNVQVSRIGNNIALKIAFAASIFAIVFGTFLYAQEDVDNYQRPSIQFEGHQFFIHVLAQDRLFDAADFDIRSVSDGLDAKATKLSYGNGTQSCRGSIQVKLRKKENGDINWMVSATSPRLIKGIKVEMTNVPFEKLINSSGGIPKIDDESGYAEAFPAGAYPSRSLPTSGIRGTWLPWEVAQFMVIEAPDKTLLLRSEDYPPQFKRYWIFRHGDKADLIIYSEANASERQKKYTTPIYFLETVDNLADGVNRHVAWMKKAYGLVPFDERKDVPEWLKNICLNLTFHCHATDGAILNTFATIEEKIKQVAKYFDPHLTHIHIVGWDGQWDFTWPHLTPDPLLGGTQGFRQLVDTAHKLGYHLGLHMNVMGLSYSNPDFNKLKHFLDHQIRDSQDRRVDWAYDWDGDEVDEKIFAYISPDYKPWRDYLIGQILKVVNEYNIDDVHLDQATTMINDSRHNHIRGLNALLRELRAALPQEVVISGEGISEPVLGLYPFATEIEEADEPIVPLLLFQPFVRFFEYGYPTEPGRGIWANPWRQKKESWSLENFYRNLEEIEKIEVIPGLMFKNSSIRADSKEAIAVYTAAERLRKKLGK